MQGEEQVRSDVHCTVIGIRAHARPVTDLAVLALLGMPFNGARRHWFERERLMHADHYYDAEVQS